MKARAHVKVSGNVQGVFFRASVLREAGKRGITGWVRNLPDDGVEAVFEGEKEKVEEMISYCRRGPHGAKVEKMAVEFQEHLGSFSDFEII